MPLPKRTASIQRLQLEPIITMLFAFIKENNLVTVQDAQSGLKELFAETIQEMLVAESAVARGGCGLRGRHPLQSLTRWGHCERGGVFGYWD